MKKIAVILLIICSLLIAVPALADDEISITVPFESINAEVLQWDFPYSDDIFRSSSEDFSQDLAKASMGLTVSAFPLSERVKSEEEFGAYLEPAGFQDIYTFGYDKETSRDTLAGIIGWKQIDDFILIAAAPRGHLYKKEWASNLMVGDEERHVGFNSAARIMEKEINSYIERNGLTGKMKLWLSGFSRAAAVSNITAADMIDSGKFEDVYACLFAVPRTTRDPDHYTGYPGIYNICGKFDPVTQVPFESWGYERYGTDLYTPAQEMDSEYIEHIILANDVSMELTGDSFYNNPEVNYQLHMILEFMGELFPTSADYAEEFQDILMTMWTEAEPERIFDILTAALNQLDNLDKRQEDSVNVFTDYLSYIASLYLAEDNNQIEGGYWNSEEGIVENVMREHTPYIYLEWVFSGCDTDDLYYGQEISRRISFFGDVDVEVWSDDGLVWGLDCKGNTIIPDSEVAWDLYRQVFIMRNGDETYVNFPAFDDYKIRIKTDGVDNLIYYEVIYTPYSTYGTAGKMFAMALAEGEYTLDVNSRTELAGLTPVSGRVYHETQMEFNYSPTVIMANESSSKGHVTIGGLFQVIFYTVTFLLLLLLVCLIIFIVHLIGSKARGRTYSSWYVIVPHVLAIIAFVLLTQFFTVNMYSIGHTRIIFAGLTMLVMFLLALRGLIRNKNVVNLIIAIGLLVIGAANLLIYQNSHLASSAAPYFIIYCICIAGLTVLAVSTFFRKRKTVS